MIRPIMSYACVSWAGGLNKKYLVRKLTKVQRLACLMISSAFPGTPTGALEILLNITPIEEFLLAEAVRGSYRITIGGLWHVNPTGSKLNGRVGAGFYAEYPNNSPKQAFFHLGIYSTVFQAEVLAISEVEKNLLLDKLHNQSIVLLVDSQAAIKALIKCTVTSITVLNCIRNLNQLGKQNHVSIAWIPGHAGVHGNEVADYVAKSGSKSKMYGPEPFITVPYVSCVSTVKDWSTDRWKSMWNKLKDCLRMKESAD